MLSKKRLIFNAAVLAIPGVSKIPAVKRRIDWTGTGGSDSARYCYSVWLRHLVKAHGNGLNCAPKSIAELGPGDSLGLGCAALLSGAEEYCALEVVAHDNLERNLAVLDELIVLFRERTAIPDDKEFPAVRPKLANYDHPASIMTDERLAQCLTEERIARIRHSIRNPNSADSMIRYSVPWSNEEVLDKESVDMIISQAVLEHVDDLAGAYRAMRLCLKPDGYMSHEIDFKSHQTAKTWDGHWAYSDFMWKLVRGKKSWLINRAPCNVHMSLIEKEGFSIVHTDPGKNSSNVPRAKLAPQFKDMPDSDMSTSELFVQAVKAGAPPAVANA